MLPKFERVVPGVYPTFPAEGPAAEWFNKQRTLLLVRTEQGTAIVQPEEDSSDTKD